MKTLTKNELIDLLKSVKGTSFVSIESETTPRLKANCPLKNLVKISKVSGAINFNYQNSVNNQRVKENKPEDFKAKSRVWGKRVKNSPVFEHRGKFYLNIKIQSSRSDYFNNNLRQSIDKVANYLYNSSTRQNLNKEIIVRQYSLDSIKRITINKQEYTVV